MSRCVDLDERVPAQYYDQECEEWTMQTVTIEDVLASVCDEYTVLPSAQPEIIRCRDCKHYYFADNPIPQEQRYVCDIGGEVWQPDDYCSYAERREVANEAR